MTSIMNNDHINKYAKKNNKKLKLHLGCGKKIISDYINIDFCEISEGKQINPDFILDIKKLNEHVLNDSVEKILIVHVLEHFNRWETVKLLKLFYNCLKPGGILEIEMPDLDGVIDFYLKNKGKPYKSPIGKINRGFVQFYGNQWNENIHETHKYVWRKKEVKDELINIGFNINEISNNARYHIRGRDMYIIAEKNKRN